MNKRLLINGCNLWLLHNFTFLIKVLVHPSPTRLVCPVLPVGQSPETAPVFCHLMFGSSELQQQRIPMQYWGNEAACTFQHAGGDIVQVQMDQSFTTNNHQLNKANPPKGNHHNLKHGNCFIQSQQQLSKILCCDWLKFAEAAGQFSCF